MWLAASGEATSDAHDPTRDHVMNKPYSTGFAPPLQAFYPFKVKNPTAIKNLWSRFLRTSDFLRLEFMEL